MFQKKNVSFTLKPENNSLIGNLIITEEQLKNNLYLIIKFF